MKWNEFIIITITVLLLFVVYAVYAGFVIKELWEWFIVPLGVNSITIMHGVGIKLLSDRLTGFGFVPLNRDKMAEYLSMAITPALAYIIGWLIINYGVM